jgi:RNA ligase (TIGR02306 family)
MLKEIQMTLDEVLSISPAQAQIVRIKDSMKTPGSDRLTSYSIEGMSWTVISSNIKQSEECPNGVPRYQPQDRVIYIAIDSILPEKLEKYLFPEDSKITLDGSRVRTLKLRGAYSQGMFVDMTMDLEKIYNNINLYAFKDGADLTEVLGIKKFEPPEASIPSHMKGKQSRKHPLFREFTEVKNFKWFSESKIFEPGELCYVSAKLHGTSARYGLLPTHYLRQPKLNRENFKEYFELLFKKVKRTFNLMPEYSYVFGSRRCQLQDKPKDYATYYEDNIYRKVGETHNLSSKLKENEILFGEIVGPGIQKGYTYNYTEHKFFAYDVMVNGRFLDYAEFKAWCEERGVAQVPDLGLIPYDLEELSKIAGAKTCHNGQKTREGIVIKKSVESNHPAAGRVCFKIINPEYLLKDQSDWH